MVFGNGIAKEAVTVSGFPVNNEALITPDFTDGNIEKYEAVFAFDANDAEIDADAHEEDIATAETPDGAQDAETEDNATDAVPKNETPLIFEPVASSNPTLAVLTNKMLSAGICYIFSTLHITIPFIGALLLLLIVKPVADLLAVDHTLASSPITLTI